MSYWTHASDGTRVVQFKGDISDVITNLDIDETPIYSSMPRKATVDIMPQVLEDSLASASLTNYHGESEVAPGSSPTTRAPIYNYCQIFMRTAEVSDTQNAVAQYGMGKELLYQEAKELIHIKRDFEATLVSNMVRQAPTPANDRLAKMNGMSTIISTNTSGTLSQANLDTMMNAIVAYGGKPTILYCDATSKATIGGFTSNATRTSPNVKHIESEVATYHSDLGPVIDVVWHYMLPKDVSANAAHALLIDPSVWVIRDLLPLTRSTLPYEGAGPATLLKAQWTVICRAQKANGYFYG